MKVKVEMREMERRFPFWEAVKCKGLSSVLTDSVDAFHIGASL